MRAALSRIYELYRAAWFAGKRDAEFGRGELMRTVAESDLLQAIFDEMQALKNALAPQDAVKPLPLSAYAILVFQNFPLTCKKNP